MKITLRFDDDDNLSEMYVDGRYCTESRLKNYMLNKPADRWLEPFNTRHVVWKGFLAEMSEIFNTRRFDIQFVGKVDAYKKFSERTTALGGANFDVSFELEEPAVQESASALDSDFVGKLLEMIRPENPLSAMVTMPLRNIQRAVEKINCNVIYENYRESQFIRQMSDCSILIDGELQISMPTILVSEKIFSKNPYDLCRQQNIDPSEAMIIVVGRNQQEIKSQAMQLKQNWQDIPIFSLTDSPEVDRAEIDQMKRLYNSYKKKIFCRLVSSYPDDTWTDPQAVKKLIAML